jgi:5S rRNA maturation endonuclease (ribonuclease M5)
MDLLGIKYQDCGYVLIGRCPIHNGDNPSAFNIYRESTKPGYANGGWICNTHHCEKKYGNDLIGLVRSIKRIGYNEAVQFLCDFCNLKSLDGIKVLTDKQLIRQATTKSILNFESSLNTSKKTYSEQNFLKSLKIPADYFINRGFSKEVLIRYKVGYNPLTDMVDVPIYDNSGIYIVGKTSRSIYEKCPVCGLYHDQNKSCPIEEDKFSKWKHVGISKRNYLYNYWFAQKSIFDCGSVVLVESPGNVWKLVENGVENCVAVLGSSFSDYQEILLSLCGTTKIFLLFDNDDAGKLLTTKLDKSLRKRYSVYKVHLDNSFNDVGDSSNEYIQKEILPQLKK